MSSTQNYHLRTNCSIYLTFSFSHLLLLSIFTHFVLYYLLHGFDAANDISSLNKIWRKCKRHLPPLGLFPSAKAFCTLLRILPRAFLVFFPRLSLHTNMRCDVRRNSTRICKIHCYSNHLPDYSTGSTKLAYFSYKKLIIVSNLLYHNLFYDLIV